MHASTVIISHIGMTLAALIVSSTATYIVPRQLRLRVR